VSITIREATVDEVIAVLEGIEEFDPVYSRSEVFERLQGRHYLAQVAVEEDRLLGFKLGYSESSNQFYSWLGGVLPHARRRGIARLLLLQQESWARSEGFRSIRVKSRNRFRNMLLLLLNESYEICGFDARETSADSRIHFCKHLT